MKRNHNTSISDSFSIQRIEMPKIQSSQSENLPRSREYWNIYNKARRLLNKNHHEEAKKELLTLHDPNSTHKALYTDLLKIYRKLLNNQLKNNQHEKAYELYKEFLNVCKKRVTTSDLKKYNKLVDVLRKFHPESGYTKIDIPPQSKKPDFTINNSSQHNLKFLDEVTDSEEKHFIKDNWKFIETLGEKIIYVKSFYNENLARYTKSLIRITNNKGNALNDTTLDHGIYRFAASENSDKYIACSEDMILYFYSKEDGCLGTYNLTSHVSDKNYVRCVNISPNGTHMLFTQIDSIYLLNSNLEIIENWRIPAKQARDKQLVNGVSDRSQNYQKHLAVLGLHGNPNNDEIKKAFRKLLLKYHPDINQEDPCANEKTQQIISTYELLTGDDAKYAFKGHENAEYYFTIIDKIKVQIPGTPIVATIEFALPWSAEDWIYATWLDNNADKIYVGCYSGKVYLVLKNGRVLKVYNCHDPIRSIKKRGQHLFIATDRILYVIKDDQYLTHIDINNCKLKWDTEGLMLLWTKQLSLYTYDGTKISDISFKKSICDVFWTNKNLTVITSSSRHSFLIS